MNTSHILKCILIVANEMTKYEFHRVSDLLCLKH